MKLIFTLLSSFSLMLTFGQGFTNYTDADGLANNNVLCVTSDGEGTMWFGTQSGISIFNGTTWETMNTTTHPGLANNNVSSIFIASSGEVWAGGDFGLSRYSGTNWTTYKKADGLGSSRITNISEGSNGIIWISEFNGATKYDGSLFTSYGSAEGLPFGGVEDILETKNGDVLMATGLGGLAAYDGSSFSFINTTNNLLINNTTALAIDSQNNVWVGTANGISVYNESLEWVTNHTRMYQLSPPDTLNPVKDIAVTSKGAVWTGIYVDYLVTEGGVARFYGDNWIDYNVDDGLVGPTIRAIAVDESDNIWVATSAGVTRIDNSVASSKTVFQSTTKIYPNPASTSLYVKQDARIMGGSISVLNTLGEQVLFETNNSKSITLNVESLKPGVYYLQISSEEKLVETFRFIKV